MTFNDPVSYDFGDRAVDTFVRSLDDTAYAFHGLERGRVGEHVHSTTTSTIPHVEPPGTLRSTSVAASGVDLLGLSLFVLGAGGGADRHDSAR